MLGTLVPVLFFAVVGLIVWLLAGSFLLGDTAGVAALQVTAGLAALLAVVTVLLVHPLFAGD